MRLKLSMPARVGMVAAAVVLVVVLVWVISAAASPSRPLVEAIASLSPTATPPPATTEPPADVTGSDGEPAQTPTPPGNTVTAKLNFLGDIAPQTDILSAAYNMATGEYDFTRLFSKVNGLISSDLTVASFESICVSTSVTEYSGRSRGYNTPTSFLTAMKDAGIDAVTLANSHILDQGMTGITQTIDNLNAAGIGHFGAYTSAGDAEQNALIDINGIKISILAYTGDVRGNESKLTSDQRDYAVNRISESAIITQIERAREKGADVVVVCLHWGELFTRKPDSDQRSLAENLLKSGADIIIGTHPQQVQSLTNKTITRTSGEEARALVAYSLGNFVSEYREQYNDSSYMLSVTIQKDQDTGVCTVLEPEYMPMWIDMYQSGGDTVFEVVPMGPYVDDAQSLTEASHARLRDAWHEVTGQIGESAGLIN